jgi:hypothetical protein
MTPEDEELFHRIDEVCYYRWDPIGVSDTARTRGEYQSYVPALFCHVKDSDFDGIVELMRTIVVHQMGLDFNREHAKQAALLMFEWKRVINERE